MMTRVILVALTVTLAVAAPALAATKFYVSKSVTDKKCTVVEVKPDGKTALNIGKGRKTKADAEKAMAAAPECKP